VNTTDKINDMDFFSKLRYTIKGPNSIGGKNDNRISKKYRDIHPSYIGKLDINVCGNSDPGTSGIITPFCKTHGLFFDDSREPESFKCLFEKDLFNYRKTNEPNKCFVSLEYENEEEYLDRINSIRDINNKFRVTRKENENTNLFYIKIKMDGIEEDI